MGLEIRISSCRSGRGDEQGRGCATAAGGVFFFPLVAEAAKRPEGAGMKESLVSATHKAGRARPLAPRRDACMARALNSTTTDLLLSHFSLAAKLDLLASRLRFVS